MLKHAIPFVKKRSHIVAETKNFGEMSEDREGGGEAENVPHLRFSGRHRAEVVIVPHKSEGALHHHVLKVSRPVHGRDFARKILPDTKMPGAPGYALPEADQARRNSGNSDSPLPEMNIASQMSLDAASKVEASLDWSLYRCQLFKPYH